MYEVISRVRLSEASDNGCMTLPGIINSFQDAKHLSVGGSWRRNEVSRRTEKSMGAFFLAGRNPALSKTWRRNQYLHLADRIPRILR